MWRSWTGLPLVFAVWAVRREGEQAHPDVVREVRAVLLDAVERARTHPVEVAAAVARESRSGRADALGMPVLLDYYRALDYSPGERQPAATGGELGPEPWAGSAADDAGALAA
ncbi:MqnA/MqnD/SBP family protein [Streptomyces sp. NPDC050619]|uniref:MqnA/MqnD/SBP family protein n=1 Tax=Streptomyces sp. NPDC050619 TaxID=3157214 RepID=UPI0034472154